MTELVSIIIPTFNRSHLLGETLDSIIAQDYEFWECIVIDDHSTDHTVELMQFYNARDKRIKFYKLPNIKLKGANSCRNFGFLKSIGNYIIWFDSDDLMTSNHIFQKIQTLLNAKVDFVISRTVNFYKSGKEEPYTYNLKSGKFKASDFILSKIHWLTYDALIKRSLAEQIQWNEQMRSWQDYNYFCKMLLISERGEFLNQNLTYRRLHDSSIQGLLLQKRYFFLNQLLENRILTYNDISLKIDATTQMELIFDMMNINFNLVSLRKSLNFQNYCIVSLLVFKNLGFSSSLHFQGSLLAAYLVKKGYSLLEKAKKKQSFQ